MAYYTQANNHKRFTSEYGEKTFVKTSLEKKSCETFENTLHSHKEVMLKSTAQERIVLFIT